LLTVKALLTEDALTRLTTVRHGFCPDPTCDIVYFSVNGDTYTKSDIRVPVWQKESIGTRTLCYCFGENELGIYQEVEMTAHSRAVERVRAHIEAGRCACEVRNPCGACCLGDVGAAVKRIMTLVAKRDGTGR
jgi:Zinc binding domain